MAPILVCQTAQAAKDVSVRQMLEIIRYALALIAAETHLRPIGITWGPKRSDPCPSRTGSAPNRHRP